MAPIKSPLPDDVRDTVGETLQGALVDLMDLSLVGKQAHWTVVGRNFRSLHLQLDELVTSARDYADLVAERAVAIGVVPDGRAATVSKESGLPAFGARWQKDTEVIEQFVAIYAAVIKRMRERITTTEIEPVTQDEFIEITANLEKMYWMFQAELAT